jgi:hypothetical protein
VNPGKKGLLGIVRADYAYGVHDFMGDSGTLNFRTDNGSSE